jgi:hypothetical protein
MNATKSQPAVSNDEAEIRRLIERWAKAVREQNRAGIRADHDSEMLIFDVPPPFMSRGSSGIHDGNHSVFVSDSFSINAGITSSARWSINWLIVLIRFMQAGQPGTTTPLPPCAIEGGWSTK